MSQSCHLWTLWDCCFHLLLTWYWCTNPRHVPAHPEEGVQRAVLHELGDDHDRTALGDHALQVDDVWMVELAHDAGFTEEVSPLLLRVSGFQSFDGHKHFSFARKLQVSAAHLSKLSCHRHGKTKRCNSVTFTRIPLNSSFWESYHRYLGY